MARNVEIKARVSDLDAIRAVARTLSSRPSEISEQTDTFFAVPRGRFKVREFGDGSGELILYERPDQPEPKLSAYTRVACQDSRALLEILGKALTAKGTVVKRREIFLVGQTRIHLDRVEGLGSFVELEVVLADGEVEEPGRRVVRQLLRALEIPESGLVATAYIDLLTSHS